MNPFNSGCQPITWLRGEYLGGPDPIKQLDEPAIETLEVAATHRSAASSHHSFDQFGQGFDNGLTGGSQHETPDGSASRV